MKKKTIATLTLAALAALCLLSAFGCGKEEIGEGPQAVLDAMFTYPNEKLFDPEAGISIGLGVENTQEDLDKAAAATEQARQNWEDEVGAYFAPNCLGASFNNGELFGAAGRASLNDEELTVKLKSAEIADQGDLYLNVQVTYTVNDEEQQALVKFSLDKDGLITRIFTE